MKTLQEIEADVAARARRIGASRHDLPTYGISHDFGQPHVEVDGALYHYVVVERGTERQRHSSASYDDLLYWIFRSVTHGMAFSWEVNNRVEDQDCRRLAFPKQIELMTRLDREMGKRLEMEIADILRRAPYNDESTKAINRMRRSIPD